MNEHSGIVDNHMFCKMAQIVDFVFLVDIASKCVEIQPFNSKVLSLLWASSNNTPYNLFSCGPDGIIIWWTVTIETTQPIQINKITTFCIPYSKQRWASAVEVVISSDNYHGDHFHGNDSIDSYHGNHHQRDNHHDDNHLGDSHHSDNPCIDHHPNDNHYGNSHYSNCHVILGDRKGSIHLFDCHGSGQNDVLYPVQTIPVLHGAIGVTQLCSRNGRLYSTGRDGTYRQYRMSQDRLELTDTKKV